MGDLLYPYLSIPQVKIEFSTNRKIQLQMALREKILKVPRERYK